MACDTTSLFATTIHLFYFPHSYHELLVTKYGCKREKSQEAKWRSAEEQRPIHEMERALDVDSFLGAQDHWAEDSPHCLTILHEMFLHATSEGRKEAECYIRWGIWRQMPQLNPEVDISTIQLVPPKTSWEELLDIYLEVYKLRRLPSSPPGEPAILKEVSAALPCHSMEEEDNPDAPKQPNSHDLHPPQSRMPQRERESSLDRSLARVRKAHRKALPTTMPRAKRRTLQLSRTISISPPPKPPKAPSPPRSPLQARTLALVRLPTPPCGFAGVVACLKTPELVEVDQGMPVGPISIGMVSNPSLSSISSSQVVKDDTTGLVYLDTVTTSIGRMVLGSMESSEGPTIEDITDQL